MRKPIPASITRRLDDEGEALRTAAGIDEATWLRLSEVVEMAIMERCERTGLKRAASATAVASRIAARWNLHHGRLGIGDEAVRYMRENGHTSKANGIRLRDLHAALRMAHSYSNVHMGLTHLVLTRVVDRTFDVRPVFWLRGT